MAVAAAEQVMVIPEDIEYDAQTRLVAAQFIGACLTRNEAELSLVADSAEAAEQTRPIESLFDAIHLAAEGDTMARNMIEINVATDVIERTMKTAHVIAVALNVDEAGRIQQFRQSMESVQANSLRYASASQAMLERTKAETVNSFRIAELHRQGVLEDYNVVVFSRAADDMPEADMQAAGFFTDTMSTSIQVTSAQGETITTESAFVAGKKHKAAVRHDSQAITEVGARLGVDLQAKTATELLATPLLVPNSAMPNGVIDLVMLYDEAAGDTFFGESKPVQNHLAYLEVCREREQRFKPLVSSITNKLIAAAPTITNRLEATERLHQLSQDQMVIQATFDDDINPQVFGPAAHYIEAARHEAEAGELQQALLLAQQGQKVAVSSSCPTGRKSNVEPGNNEGSEGKSNEEVKDCAFVSKECPKCHKKDVKTVISKGKITGSCGCTAKLK